MKYPRTYHLPWSPGVSRDDKIQYDLSYINNKLVVVTEKMDGENTTMTNNKIWARSLDSKSNESRDWVYGLWGNIRHDIPDNWRICGENMYAQHTIQYNNLDSYFLVFSIWNESNLCLSWQQTIEWCNLLGLSLVPVLGIIEFSEDNLKNIQINTESQEGYVVRPIHSFSVDLFDKMVLKWVRKNHVQTNIHWTKQWKPNKLRKK